MTTVEVPGVRSGQSKSTTDSDTVAHGAHIDCQLDADHVTAVCGTRLEWRDRNDGLNEICVVCRDLLTCPVCGTKLRMPA